MIHTLPEPTWTESENNLLPKWIRFAKEHKLQYGNPRVESLQQDINAWKRYVEDGKESVKHENRRITEAKRELARLKALELPAAEAILDGYERLLGLPSVKGVRIDSFGGLVVLVDPILADRPNDDAGVYEISRDNARGRLRLVYADRLLRNTDMVDYNTYERPGEHLVIGFGALEDNFEKLIVDAFDVAGYVEAFIDLLTRKLRYAHLKERATQERLPWEGVNVADPLAAIRKLAEGGRNGSLQQRIESQEEKIRFYERCKKDALDQIRTYQARLRTDEAKLADMMKRLAANTEGIDQKRAKEMLEYISTLPGVIAIKFDGTTPVLHVRCSFPYQGRRYDLGDFELYLTSENFHFGTVLKVRRTREPLGGSYESGWHSSVGGFCFGNRNEDIMYAFREGDFDDAVTGAIGTMNTIAPDDIGWRGMGRFAEIAPKEVWQRKPRRRARRTVRKVGMAVLGLT